MKYSLRDKVPELTTRENERAGTHHVTEKKYRKSPHDSRKVSEVTKLTDTTCRKSPRDRHKVLERTSDRHNVPELIP